jgi:hypothetical protein
LRITVFVLFALFGRASSTVTIIQRLPFAVSARLMPFEVGTPLADHEPTKTLGPQAARLVAILHERGRTLFTHADIEEITGLSAKSARNGSV